LYYYNQESLFSLNLYKSKKQIMKKLFALIAVTGMLFMLASNIVYAQEPEAEQAEVELLLWALYC